MNVFCCCYVCQTPDLNKDKNVTSLLCWDCKQCTHVPRSPVYPYYWGPRHCWPNYLMGCNCAVQSCVPLPRQSWIWIPDLSCLFLSLSAPTLLVSFTKVLDLHHFQFSSHTKQMHPEITDYKHVHSVLIPAKRRYLRYLSKWWQLRREATLPSWI